MRINCFHALISALFAGLFALPAHATQVDIPAPAGSSAGYAANIVVLPNGNIIVVDASYGTANSPNDGQVYLLNGATLAVISTLKGGAAGSGGITVLSNGNFVISSPNWGNGAATGLGAVTWGSATTGVDGNLRQQLAHRRHGWRQCW